jgi:hypothetical protein
MSHSLTLDRLRAVIDYSIVTGRFYWKKTGKRAGCHTKTDSYRRLRVDTVLYLEQRLAVFWLTGEWPIALVDHVNEARTCNAWHNLREATKAQNGCNRKATSLNTSGFKGVVKCPVRGFKAVVGVQRRNHYGPIRTTPEEAYADACRLRNELHGSFANHG